MNNKTAVVLGSTGLVGKNVVEELISNDNFSAIRLLVRKAAETSDKKIEIQITDFNNLTDFTKKTGKADFMFCAIGTTLQKVKGNKKLYRQIDYDIIVNAAKISAAAGFRQFILVSTVGANAQSANFYLKLKGEIEQDISALPFEGVHIFRPSIIIGSRNEFRLAEKIGQNFMKLFSFLFIGSLSKYKGILASDIAKAMVKVADADVKGVHIYEYNQIKKLL